MVTLLAAAEVLEELEQSKTLTVTEVAGTSAGSIAAYLFASNKSTELLRAKMKSAGRNVISHFSKRPSMTALFWKMYRGEPIFSEAILASFVREIVTEKDGDRLKLKDARIPVHICVSDIKNGNKQIYNRENSMSIEQVLVDSCAIPIAFRTFKDKSGIADGGVTSNLVGPEVFNGTDEKIIALSFARSAPYEYKDAASYILSLASTAIDSSVEESQAKIKAMGGYVCELPNEYGTFDFEDALNKGLTDANFAATKRTIREIILEALSAFERTDRLLDLKNDLGRVQTFASTAMDSIISQYPYSVVASSTLCVANCLAKQNTGGYRQPDKVIKDVHISALSDKLMAFRIGLTREEHYELGKDIQWEIRDSEGNNLSVSHEVVENKQGDEIVYQSCFCLDQPIAKSLTPVRIRLVTTHMDIMGGLIDQDGSEWMRSESHQNDQVVAQDFVFCSPPEAGEFVLTDLLQNYHRATAKPSKLENMEKKWHTGSVMIESDLDRYRNDHLYLANYKFTGWRCENTPAGAYVGALIERAT